MAPLSAPAFVCSPQTTFWRSLDQSVIDQRYLRYVLVSSDFQRQLGVFGGQTDMAPYVSLTDQRSMEIDVPDIAEQQAIAKVLGALDDKIAANNVVAATARELARVLYDRAVRGEQNDTMSRLLTPFLGGTPSRAEAALWDGSVPWVSAKDVTGAAHGVITDTVEGISESAAKTKRLRPLPAGSVVLTLGSRRRSTNPVMASCRTECRPDASRLSSKMRRLRPRRWLMGRSSTRSPCERSITSKCRRFQTANGATLSLWWPPSWR